MYSSFIQKDFPAQVVDFNLAGDLENTPPLIAGNINSVMIGNGSTRTLSFVGLSPGTEKNPFTLELWIAPLKNTEVYAFNHTNVSIKYNNGLYFTVNVNNASVSLYYKPEQLMSMHVVATYDGLGMTLYVNGRVVDSVQFDNINSANWLTDTDVIIGEGTGRAIIDGLAYYNRQITAQEVDDHYLLGRSIPAITTNLTSMFATIYNFEDQENYLLVEKSWPDWLDGVFQGGEVVDGLLVSDEGSIWQGIIPINDYELLARGKVSWQGIGQITVEVSKNGGVTWTPVLNNKYIPDINESAPMVLDIKVTLGASSSISRLTVKLFGSLLYNTNLNDGVARYTNENVTTPDEAYDQIEYRSDRGLSLDGSSSFRIEADPSDTDLIYGIDMWVKVEGPGDLFRFDSGPFVSTSTSSGGTMYINGSPAAFSSEPGEWIHVIYVLNTPAAANLTVGGAGFSGSIGNITLYRKSIANKHQRIYRSYFGGQRIEIQEPSALSVSESASPWDLYSYNWSTVGA